MTIYGTMFDPKTMRCTGKSFDSGFISLDQCVEMMGEPKVRHRPFVVYDGTIFSNFPWSLDDEPLQVG